MDNPKKAVSAERTEYALFFTVDLPHETLRLRETQAGGRTFVDADGNIFERFMVRPIPQKRSGRIERSRS